jgi:hypothetical protein
MRTKRGRMLVFWDQRLAFLATPKTGSTAIEAALESLSSVVIQRPPVMKHTSAQRFHRFMGPYCSDAPPDFAAVGSQSRFLAEKRGRGVDHLFAYEKIDGFVAFLEARLNFEITLPRLNVSPKGDLRLSPDTEALFRSFCAKDIELYNSIST